jgi:hypothetical protein
MCEVQTLEHMMDENYICDVSEGEAREWESENSVTFLSSVERTETVRKYIMKFGVDDNTMAALSRKWRSSN